AAHSRAYPRTVAPRSLCGVHDVVSAVLVPAAFVVLAAHRTLFTVADDLDLAGRSTRGFQRGRKRIATTLAEAKVVLAGAAFVGIAFDRHARHRAITQVLGVAGDDILELRLDFALVEVEVDHAGAQAGVGLQVGRGERTFGGGRGGGRGRLRGWSGFDFLFLCAGRSGQAEQCNYGDANGCVHGESILSWTSE